MFPFPLLCSSVRVLLPLTSPVPYTIPSHTSPSYGFPHMPSLPNSRFSSDSLPLPNSPSFPCLSLLMGHTRHDTRYLRAVPYRSSASPCPLLLSIPAQTPGSSSLIGFPASPCPSGAFLPCSPAHNPWAFLGLCASPASPGPIQTSVPSLCPFGLSTPPSPGSSSVLGFHASACPSSISSPNVLPDKPWDFLRLCGSLPPLLLTHPGQAGHPLTPLTTR